MAKGQPQKHSHFTWLHAVADSQGKFRFALQRVEIYR